MKNLCLIYDEEQPSRGISWRRSGRRQPCVRRRVRCARAAAAQRDPPHYYRGCAGRGSDEGGTMLLMRIVVTRLP